MKKIEKKIISVAYRAFALFYMVVSDIYNHYINRNFNSNAYFHGCHAIFLLKFVNKNNHF